MRDRMLTFAKGAGITLSLVSGFSYGGAAFYSFFSAHKGQHAVQTILLSALSSLFNNSITLPETTNTIILPALTLPATIAGNSLAALLTEFLASENITYAFAPSNKTFNLIVNIPAGVTVPLSASGNTFTLLQAFGDTLPNFINQASSTMGTVAFLFLIVCGALLTYLLIQTVGEKLYAMASVTQLQGGIKELKTSLRPQL